MIKKAIIVGAGPAGLTAAYELLQRTDIVPIILEKSGDIGGISKTVNYKGNRMDIGGHRFFSKSDRVMQWWLNIMPVQPQEEKNLTITYQRRHKTIKTEEPLPKFCDPEPTDKVMLVRRRLSRIYFLRKFFSYPIQLSLDTLKKLGLGRTVGILLSYLRARLFPRKSEKTLEDFFINRFGDKLYRLFFKDYTEKVWGVSCTNISAEWGAQRIKGISIGKAIAHAAKSLYPAKRSKSTDIGQKGVETSLIEKFLYPKYGPGQLWEEVAKQVQERGGQILMHQDVQSILSENHTITGIEAANSQTGETTVVEGDYFFSTMPVQELIAGLKAVVPPAVQEVAAGLQYRDFITVGVLLRKMPPPDEKSSKNAKKILPDTWIYIQERDVKVGRLQIFNNWSPYMVKDANTVWVGMEYFCNKGDDFWSMSDEEIKATAFTELTKMDLATAEDLLDSTVLRVEKTYPAYFGTYSRFGEIRAFTDQFVNLFLVGRNGMHKYNNSDHSMLTAMVAVDNIAEGVTTKGNIWSINTEQEYHEEKGTTNETVSQKQKPALSPSPNLSLKDYIFKNPVYKYFVWVGLFSILLQFVVFKFLYPYASFINGDSYVYLQTAFLNYDVNTYPIGYSKFLRIFSVFTNSDTALVAFQYLLLQASVMSFLFTLFYFYKPGKLVKIILFGFMLFNPIFLYMANYISSDALFISLSLIWFTMLIWIIQRPTTRLLLFQALILFFAFTVRYNALYYPIIGAIAFLLSKQRIVFKIAGIALGLGLIGVFVFYSSQKYYELAGKKEFSPFTGWQMANNAMYAYKFVDNKNVKNVPTRFQQLDKMVRTYFDTTKNPMKFPQEMLVASTVYMWDPQSPLQIYMNNQFKKDSTAGPVKRWATVAPLYADYGSYLIKQYPLAFAKYYLWPNALKYYAPPVEFLENYSTGIDSVQPIAQNWFGYKTNKLKTYFKDLKVNALDFYPVLVGIMNVIFLSTLIGFLFLHGIRLNPSYGKILLLVAGLWLINFGFSVFASPIALRFQLFPILVFLPFSFFLLERIYKIAFAKSTIEQ
jgi:protoporphyrinogen oxidase